MNETLKALYHSFYTRPEVPAAEAEAEAARHALGELLDKQGRRLVLRIIDAKDEIADARSLDSFICGFRLAWRLAIELNQYDSERPEFLPGAHRVYQDVDSE